MDGLSEKFKQFKTFSETNKQYLSGIMNQSPLTRTKLEIENQILKAERYRASVLQNVVAFKGMTQESLSSAAQILEEVYYNKDDKIICQDDFGDTFYILEEGMVSIRRKMNMHDPNEIDKELAIRGKDFHFGDVALLTGEPRSATIVVISETAKCLRMNKTKFDDISSAAKKLMATNRNLICRGAVEKLPFFNTLSKKNKTRLVETMIEVNYIAGTYIHRQGTIDNAFHIITDGECIVTVNSDDTQERELKTLCPGDYFGEKSLTDSSTTLIKRAYNFIAKTSVTCVVLSNADYSYFVGQDDNIGISDNFKRMLVNNNNNSTGNSNTNNSSSSSSTHNNNNSNGKHDDKKYDSTLNMLKLKNANRRRVTIYDNNGQPSSQRAASILRRYAKFSTEALFLSLYARMYRDLKLVPEHIELYGKVSSNIMAKNLTCRKTIEEIRYQATRALSTDRSRRSHADISFIAGLLSQKNMLKDIYCFNLPPYQFTELCKKITFMQIPSLSKIVEVGNKGTSAYLILRGAVRIFTKSQGTERVLHYEEDLCSGQMFAEDSLNGQRTILITAQALTPVDLAVIECEDYTGAQEKSAMKMTIEDRYQFLANIPHFKHCEPVHLFSIAHKLLQKESEKNNIIVKKGDSGISCLYFLIEGRLDVIGSTKHHANTRAVTSVQKYGMFGEIGILNSRLTAKQLKQSRTRFHEEFDYICVTKIEYFELPVDVFHYFDDESYQQIKKACMTKTLWRKGRYYDIRLRETNKLTMPLSTTSSLQPQLSLSQSHSNSDGNITEGCNGDNNGEGNTKTNWYDIPTADDNDDIITNKNHTNNSHHNASYHQLLTQDEQQQQQAYNSNCSNSSNNNNNNNNTRTVSIDYTLPVIHTASPHNNNNRKSSSSSFHPASSAPNNFFINSEQSKLNSLLTLQSSNISNPLMVLTTCKTPLQTQRTLAYIRSAQKLLLPQLSHEHLNESEFLNSSNGFNNNAINSSNNNNNNGSDGNNNNINNCCNNSNNNNSNNNHSSAENVQYHTHSSSSSSLSQPLPIQQQYDRTYDHNNNYNSGSSYNNSHDNSNMNTDKSKISTISNSNNNKKAQQYKFMRNNQNIINKVAASTNKSSNAAASASINVTSSDNTTATLIRPVSSHALQRWNEYQYQQLNSDINNQHSGNNNSSNLSNTSNNTNSGHSKSMNELPKRNTTMSSSYAAVMNSSGNGTKSNNNNTSNIANTGTTTDSAILHVLKTRTKETQRLASVTSATHNHKTNYDYYNDEEEGDGDGGNGNSSSRDNVGTKNNRDVNNGTSFDTSSIGNNNTMMLRGSHSLPTGITLTHFLN